MFGILALLSLLLFATVVGIWVRSFGEDRALVSWVRAGDRYTLRSHSGQFVVAGPPGEAAADAEMEAIAGRMSNEDFTWTPLDGGYVQGEVREGTATWEAYTRFKGDLEDAAKRAGAVRVWLRGLEEARTFAPSHLMLLLVAEDRWRARWVDEAKQPWREASAAGDRLILFTTADATGAGPNGSRIREVRDRWHVVLDEGRGRVFHGWIALGALALPLAWAARPRREPRTWTRWAFNIVALASVLLLFATGAVWARSYRTVEQWTFAPWRGEAVPGLQVDWRVQRWMVSGNGRMVVYEHQVPDGSELGFSVRAQPSGYARNRSSPDFFRALMSGGPRSDERQWKVPGAQFYAMPPQVVRGGVGRGTAVYGMRYLEVSWWVLFTAGAFAPLIWIRRHWQSWRRAPDGFCQQCGYDLRASAGRCPECGTPVPGRAGADKPDSPAKDGARQS